jgi:hypothetical protein
LQAKLKAEVFGGDDSLSDGRHGKSGHRPHNAGMFKARPRLDLHHFTPMSEEQFAMNS